LLSNVVLDELDKILEVRGHRFVRYADDVIILVGSRAAAERVRRSVTALHRGPDAPEDGPAEESNMPAAGAEFSRA
jgi:hypothetical protein